MPGFVSVIIGILLFSILIFVHELGHFMAAKAFGVQVNEFSMFMGPAIYKKKKGETLYTIRCIPLGGYCAMEGEDQDTDNPRSFQKASWWKRLIILVAGATMNFIIGIVFFAIFVMPAQQIATPVITEFTDCCVFHGENGLVEGDEIVMIDGERIYTASNISMLLSLNESGVHDIVVNRAGEQIVLEDLPMAHMHQTEDGQEYTHYGISMGLQKATFGLKLKTIWNTTLDNMRSVRLSLQMMFSGKVGLSDMAGPVGIVDMMSEAATTAPSWQDALLTLIYFGGFLAVNLGIMNLLPIPALDGGRVIALLLTVAVERITKKKIDPKYEGYIHAAGMILLLGLMAIILFKDIFTVFKG
jgi:regulator of sigma E protease